MNRQGIGFVVAAIALSSFSTASAQNWKLVWSDEFNAAANTGADPTKWIYNTTIHVNNELEQYTNSIKNAFHDGQGNIVLRGLHESSGNYQYTSGRLESNGKYSFKYGRLECRAKLPAGGGSWPAIWMLGIANVGWPSCGEIDIMEQWGNNKSFSQCNTFSGSFSGGGMTANYPFQTATTAVTDFHIYELEWYEDHLDFFVDENKYKTGTFGHDSPFYNNAHYIILNVAIGGMMGGLIDTINGFPMDMIVDYVRVFQNDSTVPLIRISAADSIVEGAENGKIINVLTRNDKFKSTLAVSNWEIENLPGGVSLGSVQRVNDTLAYLILSGNAVVGTYWGNITNVTVTAATAEMTNATVPLVSNRGVTLFHAPFLLPRKIEAELYDTMVGIQTEITSDQGGGLDVGYVDNGDYLGYNVRVPYATGYIVGYRIAGTGGRIDLTAKGKSVGIVSLPSTGGYQNWQTVYDTVSLDTGVQTLRLTAAMGGFNINWIEFAYLNPSLALDHAPRVLHGCGGLSMRVFRNGRAAQLLIENAPGIKSVSLYSVDGRVVFRIGIHGKYEETVAIPLDTKKIPAGIYVVSAGFNDAQVTRRIALSK
jgi:beta-glucanase (GH16 family)